MFGSSLLILSYKCSRIVDYDWIIFFIIQLCQEMLDVIAKVDPGFTKTRGIMLSEMNKTKLVMAKTILSNPENTQSKIYKKLWEKACLEKQFLNMYLAYYQNMFHNKKWIKLFQS